MGQPREKPRYWRAYAKMDVISGEPEHISNKPFIKTIFGYEKLTPVLIKEVMTEEV